MLWPIKKSEAIVMNEEDRAKLYTVMRLDVIVYFSWLDSSFSSSLVCINTFIP